MNNYLVAGVDIGGSHITGALVDLNSHSIIAGSLRREHINSQGTAGEIIKGWADVIRECFSDMAPVEKKIGIAIPGPFNYKEGVCLIKGLNKYEGLYGLNVKMLLANELQIDTKNILLMNDASCFLKGEVFSGAASQCNNVMGVTLGTGLGSARYHDGKIFDGDLYYSPFKDGTAEDYLSGRWFLKRYKELTGSAVSNVKELCENITDDPCISSVFTEFGSNLGDVLKKYIQKHNCDTIVIGGNIANAWEFFFHETVRTLSTLSKAVSVKKAELGEQSALIGAASLWT